MTKKATKSVARTLTSVLAITRWAMWFILVTLPLAALNAPFFPLQFGGDPADPDAKLPTAYIGPVIEQEGTRAAFLLETFIAMLLTGLGLFIIHHLLRILTNVQNGAAFVCANGDHLRKIGFAAAGVQLSIYGLWFVSWIIGLSGGADFDGLSVTISPAPWIGVLGAFALSTVFLEGAALKEEQDLTV